MKRSRRALALFAAVLLSPALLLPSGAQSQAPAPPPVSPEPIPPEPVPPELQAQHDCQRGDALTETGQFDGALTAYTDALTANSSATCATQGLASLQEARVQALCERGAVLEKRDKDAEAKQAYLDALSLDPASACAEQGLEPSPTNAITTWLDDVASPAQVAIKALGVAALYLACLVGALLLLSLLWLAGRLLRPTLDIQAFGDSALTTGKVGPGLSAMVKGLFVRHKITVQEQIEEGDVPDQVALLSAPEDLGAAVQKLSGFSPRFTVIAAIVSFVEAALPLPRFTVKGEMQPGGAPASPSGATVILEKKGELTTAIDLWEQHDVPLHPPAHLGAEPHQYWLATATTAWIEYQLIPLLNPAFQPATEVWESYLRLLAGTESFTADRHDEAEKLFGEALTLDPTNWSVRANLALLALRGHDYAEAVDHFRRVLKIRRDQDEQDAS